MPLPYLYGQTAATNTTPGGTYAPYYNDVGGTVGTYGSPVAPNQQMGHSGAGMGGVGGLAHAPQRAPGSLILQDSNPSARPMGSVAQIPPRRTGLEMMGGRLNSVLSGGGGGGQQTSGAILGSSAGNPSFYGAGLAPASGLGGGLYPSLVSLYR